MIVPSDAGQTQDSLLSSRVIALLTVMNPILLLVMGAVLNKGIDNAKLEISKSQAQIQDLKTAAETSSINARIQVDKVKVIQDFLSELSGPNETRRQIAIEAIFIVLPDEAPRLVKVIETQRAGADAKDAMAAKSALERTRTQLVADMFSEVRSTRVNALHGLQRGWTDDPNVIGKLIDRAMQDVRAREASGWKNPPGTPDETRQLASISNTAEFVASANTAEPELRAKIVAFANAASMNSDDTRRFAQVIKERFR